MTRRDEKSQLFWKNVQNKAANLCIDPPKLPRKKRVPPRIEERLGGNATPGSDKHIVSYNRKVYCEALDYITNAITNRLDQHDFKTYIKLENLLIKAVKGDDFHTVV